MSASKGKRAAVLTAAAVALILLVGGLAFRDPIREAYYLLRLSAGGLKERQAAAASLGEIGSRRALHGILRELESRSLGFRLGDAHGLPRGFRIVRAASVKFSPDGRVTHVGDSVPGGSIHGFWTTEQPTHFRWQTTSESEAIEGSQPPFYFEALGKIATRLGAAAVPDLVGALESTSCGIQVTAALLVARLGPIATGAGDALRRLENAQGPVLRAAVRDAIEAVGGRGKNILGTDEDMELLEKG